MAGISNEYSRKSIQEKKEHKAKLNRDYYQKHKSLIPYTKDAPKPVSLVCVKGKFVVCFD